MEKGAMSNLQPDSSDKAPKPKGLLDSLAGAAADMGKQAVDGAVDLVTPKGLNAFSGRMRLHGENGPAPASLNEVDGVLAKAGSKGLDALMGPGFEQQALRGAEEIFSRGTLGRDRNRARDGHEIGG